MLAIEREQVMPRKPATRSHEVRQSRAGAAQTRQQRRDIRGGKCHLGASRPLARDTKQRDRDHILSSSWLLSLKEEFLRRPPEQPLLVVGTQEVKPCPDQLDTVLIRMI